MYLQGQLAILVVWTSKYIYRTCKYIVAWKLCLFQQDISPSISIRYIYRIDIEGLISSVMNESIGFHLHICKWKPILSFITLDISPSISIRYIYRIDIEGLISSVMNESIGFHLHICKWKPILSFITLDISPSMSIRYIYRIDIEGLISCWNKHNFQATIYLQVL